MLASFLPRHILWRGRNDADEIVSFILLLLSVSSLPGCLLLDQVARWHYFNVVKLFVRWQQKRCRRARHVVALAKRPIVQTSRRFSMYDEMHVLLCCIASYKP